MNNPLALNPFKKGNKGDVEPIQKVEVEKCPDLERLIDLCHKIPCGRDDAYYVGLFDGFELPVLSSNKINYLLQYVIDNELVVERGKNTSFLADKSTVLGVTGYLISRLIQESYDDGNNDFVLNTLNGDIKHLAVRLKGESDNPINISIIGDVSDSCAIKSEYLNLKIHGNVGSDLGEQSEFCNYEVHGNVYDSCADRSENSTYLIDGNVGRRFAYNAKYCDLTIIGKSEEEFAHDAKNSRFNIFGDAVEVGTLSSDCNYNVFGNIMTLGKSSWNSNYVVNGNVEYVGRRASNSTFLISGNTGFYCGEYSKKSLFCIGGNVGERCGSSANESSFYIQGNANDNLGRCSEDSSFIVNGDVMDHFGIYSERSSYLLNKLIGKKYVSKTLKDAIVRVVDEETFNLLTEKKPQTNIYHLIDKDRNPIKEVYFEPLLLGLLKRKVTKWY